MTQPKLNDSHTKNTDFEYDVFQIDGHYFVFDPHSLSAFAVDRNIYDTIAKATNVKKVFKLLQPLYEQGFFRPEIHLGTGQWSKKNAGITLMNTNVCNLRCPYCVMDHTQRVTQVPFMTLEKAKQSVDYLFEDFGKNASRLSLSFSLTGEPLLNLPLMQQVAEYVKNKERIDGRTCQLYFSTNGTLVDEEVLEFICHYQVMVNVSIDGSIFGHDIHRFFPSGKGSYEAAVEGAKLLLSHSKSKVTCSPTLTAQNYNICEIFREVWNLGFRTIAMKPVRGKREQSFSFNETSVQKLQKSYLEFARWLLSLPDDELFHKLCSLVPPSNDYFGRMIGKIYLQTRDLYRCEAGKTDIAIDADGQIYSCFSVVGSPEMKLGNIDTPSATLQCDGFWQMGVDQRLPCKECSARYTCGGGCACTAFQANQDYLTPDPIDCAIQIFLTRLAIYTVARLQAERPVLYQRLYEHMWNNSLHKHQEM